MNQAPPGWHPDHDDVNLERFWDGQQWTEQRRPAASAASVGGGVRDRLASAAGRLTGGSGELPADTVWSAVGRPVTGIGAGRYRMDANYLYFEKGALRTDSQQVPIAQVLDVDVKQSMTQKARGVFTVTVHIQRPSGVEIVHMEDIPEGREAQRRINDAAHAARYAIQQRQNTMRYEGVAPAVTQAPAPTTPDAAQDPIAQLEKLASLRDAGVLTEEEFAAKKAEILSRM